MSNQRYACAAHYKQLDIYDFNKSTNTVSTKSNLSTKTKNSKAHHANLLFEAWRAKRGKVMFSRRLGISYTSCYRAANDTDTIDRSRRIMYFKRLEDFEITLSKNPKTARKQETRFQRACRRVFSVKENAFPLGVTSNMLTFREKLKLAKKHRFLFRNHLPLNKPIKHLRYRKLPLFPIAEHYNYNTPAFTFSPPPNSSKSDSPPIIREKITGIPDDLLPLQLKQAHDRNEQGQIKQPKNKKTTFYSPSTVTNPPLSTAKSKFLVTPDELLLFVPDGPLFNSVGQIISPGTSAFLNKLRDRKRAHEKGITKNQPLPDVNTFHKEISTLVERLKELDDETIDTGSTSTNQPKLSLRKALIAKMYKNFDLPYSSVIDSNQPRHHPALSFTPNGLNHTRIGLPPSKKRTFSCLEDDYASAT
ncbi:hypothetical protein RhiirA4_461655 [Rhizophagus irregularis]|uniref:DUF8211 domain-containing protein n=1 Tax=Rhizophagus irregularis TaxID=588596 RepID=A0A2I1GJB2_9GLOM|nr:hypothetical protein RhiirA4_461655 [Rhizophagus irregularis]